MLYQSSVFAERTVKTILASSEYFRDIFQQNDWYVRFETPVYDFVFFFAASHSACSI